ncbi:hypothetical protein Tco_0803985 [Tanacetum coccineum]|uniref:Uncharacterized protein n=1 Tax=Tanacetum coccineum TaxID=301880 RepID=A0ABQ5A768_9ASTR
MIYSGSAKKLLFTLLYSSSTQLESYFTSSTSSLRWRKPYNVAYTLSGTKLNTESYFEEENVVLMNAIALFRQAIGSSVERNDVLDEQLVQSMIADELVLYMVVVVEEMCRIVVFEELSKTVNDTVMDCTEVNDCCSMEVCCRYAYNGSKLDSCISSANLTSVTNLLYSG